MPSDKHIRPTEVLDLVSTPYYIMKRSKEYPEYERGADIDIMCADANEAGRQILHLASSYLQYGWRISVHKEGYHTHIDFSDDEGLVLRFDLIDTLDNYKEVLMSGNEMAECGLRLLEYAKYPQKEKHLNYVKEKLND